MKPLDKAITINQYLVFSKDVAVAFDLETSFKVEILTQICEVVPHGHHVVMKAMTSLRVQLSESVRFKFLVNLLNSSQGSSADFQRKTDRGNTPQDVMERAVQEVLVQKRPCRAVAKDFEIPHVTLRRYVLKHKANFNEPEAEDLAVVEVKLDRYGYAKMHAIFKPEHEALLVQYLLKASKLYYGLCPKEVRRLAYEYASQLDLNMPRIWIDNECAGKDWMNIFLKKHKNMSLRTPEATSLGRATSFNRHNVTLFFNNYDAVLEKDGFTPDKIWNLDESGCTTVQRPARIIAETGCKQVGAIVSAERGTLVTICCAVGATGNTIPPMFVFPRVHFRDHFLHGAPPGSIGAAHQSGWMTAETFPMFMRHFVAHVNCTQNNKVLLILDNHDSHISLDVIDYARANGVVLLSFPPHCLHKMQLLDRTVFGPFKTYYNAAADDWMKENKGKTMTIYEIPALVGKAFPRAMTPVNIQSGFRVSGIYPLDRNIFTDDEFLPADVTDRPLPNGEGAAAVDGAASDVADADQPIPGPSTSTDAEVVQQTPNHARRSEPVRVGVSSGSVLLTPEDIRPFEKAAPRKKKGGRKPGRTRILTATPERAEIA
ncbi:hypothetical protein GQR58_014449 [Nymphon striatum]|nr:hypothetical protein GQR58_014449 [Nymphon striatum]